MISVTLRGLEVRHGGQAPFEAVQASEDFWYVAGANGGNLLRVQGEGLSTKFVNQAFAEEIAAALNGRQ